jgi:hypothetical protein
LAVVGEGRAMSLLDLFAWVVLIILLVSTAVTSIRFE